MSENLNRKVETLIEVISDITYLPSPEQRRAKSSFWTRFSDNPLCDPSDISLSVIDRVLGDSRLGRWWKVPGFPDWFRNQEEFRERVEGLIHVALDTLEQVMFDPKAQASAKVNAAKLLMEVGRKMPPKSVREIYVDEKISRMDRKELEEYIRRNTPKLVSSEEEK